jgi:polysaccharide export outer membrane protein
MELHVRTRIMYNIIIKNMKFPVNQLCRLLSAIRLCPRWGVRASLSPVSGRRGTLVRRRTPGGRYAGGLSVLMAFLLAGCQGPKHAQSSDVSRVKTSGSQATTPPPETLTLREGDTVRITFPGSPNLNTVQQIRRDGKISLPLVGECKAAGVTPSDLEKELVKLYAPQLVTKEVNVALESSAYFVFVTGAVARPGRIMFDRPITALQAAIDAGLDYSKANLKDVTVIRRQGGREEQRHLNLKQELQGRGGEPFYLQPSDIVFVRERFTWF